MPFVSRRRSGFPTSRQAWTDIGKRTGLNSDDATSAHTEKQWRWEVSAAKLKSANPTTKTKPVTKTKPAKPTTKSTLVATLEGNPIVAEIKRFKTKPGDTRFRVILRATKEELPPTGTRIAGVFKTQGEAEQAARDKIDELGGGPVGKSKARPDRTPSRPARPGRPSLAMKIDSRTQIEFVPEDLLASALAMLFAMRLETARIGEEEGEFVTLLTDWFSSDASRRGGLTGIDQTRKDLTDEIQFFREMFGALAPATAKIGFTVEEWSRAFFAITGEPEVSFGEVELLGLDAPLPPVVADITTNFSVEHPAIDIASKEGTPVRAPEDIIIAKTDRVGADKGLGKTIAAWSRTPELGDFPELGSKGAIEPEEGVRRHGFGHLSSISVNPGDRIERGGVIGHSGNTGTKTKGPHLHWSTKVYVVQGNLFGLILDATGIALPGAVALTPMDPTSLVPADVIEGGGVPRGPSVVWNMVNPDKPESLIAGPSYDIRVGTGDVIFDGTKNTRTSRSDVTVDPDVDVEVGIGLLRPSGERTLVRDPRFLPAPGGRPGERLVRSPGLLGLDATDPTPASPFEPRAAAARGRTGIRSEAEREMELTRGAARERVAVSGVTGAVTGAGIGAAGGPIGAAVGAALGAAGGIATGLLGLPAKPAAGRPRRRRQR